MHDAEWKLTLWNTINSCVLFVFILFAAAGYSDIKQSFKVRDARVQLLKDSADSMENRFNQRCDRLDDRLYKKGF